MRSSGFRHGVQVLTDTTMRRYMASDSQASDIDAASRVW